MTATFEVFWNTKPEEQSELAFLEALKADLDHAGISAMVLANYFTNSGSRQIDFLVITAKHVCHAELKSYEGIIRGSKNGPWAVEQADGTVEVFADRPNPYTQASACTMAISDDMHEVARRDARVPRPPPGKRFYTQIDSVVCIFPRLEAGSEVPNDYKVKTLGYADFVQFLITPGRNPRWTHDHWSALIRSLGLTSAARPPQRAIGKSVAQAMVDEYLRWFKDFYARDLHELVPLPLDVGNTRISPSEFVDVLQEAKHTQLIGPSGSGKSHLAKHALIGLSATSLVPILVEGTMYQGRLFTLLNRSVAPFISAGAEGLLKAAAINGQTILLVIDGYNECSESLRERLLGDLSAFCRRTAALTLLTSQATVTMPGPLTGQVLRIGSLTEGDRQAVLSSYGAPEILHLSEPFTTAYELSIAAECAGEIHGTLTRAALFAAFIRRRLSGVASPAATRDVLRQLALAMDDRLTTSLPLDDVWRIAEQRLTELSAPASVIDDVFMTTVTTSRQGRLSLSHELLGRFLAAEALLRQHHELAELVEALRRPRHQDLTEFAVELESSAGQAAQLLEGLADWHLYAQALRGYFGTTAHRVSQSAARRLLQAVTQGMDSMLYTIHPEYELTVVGGYELSDAGRAMLAAVGALLHEGEFLQDVATLLDATDAACRRSADAQAKAERRRPTVSTSVAAVLVGMSGTARSSVAASIIFESMNGTQLDSRFRAFPSKPPVRLEDLMGLIDAATSKSNGRLMLLCALLQAMDGLEAAAQRLPLLRLCWDSGAYHVQIEGLTMIQSFAAVTRGDPLHDEIADYLESLSTDNLLLSTQLVETLYSYGRIESPYEEQGIREDIETLLANPFSAESGQLAYSIVSNQFEDVIAEPYFTAIESLSRDEKVRLYTMASLGAPSTGFWNDWLLSELVNFAEVQALPAFKHWATHLNPDTPFQQGFTACYLLAIQGCALFLDKPPEIADCQTSDQAAWRCYGAIIFWMHRLKLDSERVRARCAADWQQLASELLPAAVDPLCQFMWASSTYERRGGAVVGRLLKMFQDEVRPILELGLEHRDSLSSLFPPHTCERPSDIIDMLGWVGNPGTVDLLRAYTDDKSLGRAAISSIRQLTQ